MDILGGGVQRAGRQIQIQRQGVLFLAGNHGKNGVQLDQIGLIRFQKRIQFFYEVLHLLIDGFVIVEFLEADGKFHERTCRISEQ
jgi:hypothetical protein